MYNPFDFLDFITNGGSIFDIRGEVIGTDTLHSHSRTICVDTCFTNDTCKYETAVKVNNDPIIVVEQYDTKEEAYRGHNRWIQSCLKKEFTLSSVQHPEVRVYE